MLIIKNIIVDQTEYQVTISDDSKALQAAYAAGGAIIGIWEEGKQGGTDFSSCLYFVTDPEDADERMLEQVVRRRFSMPWLIGETKRLQIREFKEDDPLEEPQEESGGGFYGETGVFSDREKRTAYIESKYRFSECGLWALVEKETGVIVGKAGITDGELGYHIYTDFRRRGYALEACEEILEYGKARMKLRELHLEIAKENTRSVKLASRLGFLLLSETQDTLLYKKRL